MKFALTSLLVVAAALAGCDHAQVSASTPVASEEAQPNNMGAPVHGLSQTLIGRIANSRQYTLFQGARRVEVNFDDGVVQRHLLMHERVSSDGHGDYAIETLDVLEPPMNDSQRTVFLALQSIRQGMYWRYRDFAIHDISLFMQNYRIVDTGMPIVVAGRACKLFDVERVDQSGSVYTLGIDIPTGLVLSSREETHQGSLISDMTYESIDLAPDLSGVVWHQSMNNELALPMTGSVSGFVGFEARAPRTLPTGYQLQERSSLLHPQDGSKWVKETYGDGVESLFFLHGGPIVNGNGIKSGVPEIQADLVEVTAAPPWTVARGNLSFERVIALGKISEHDLLDMLQSAME